MMLFLCSAHLLYESLRQKNKAEIVMRSLLDNLHIFADIPAKAGIPI